MSDTIETLTLAIKERRELINKMVGQLYPSIVAEEIVELLDKRAEFMKKEREEK